MRTKDDSVRIDCLTVFISDKLKSLDKLVKEYTGNELIITSGCELTAKHMQGSKHYTGNAIDIRTWELYAMGKDKLTEFSRKLRKLFPKGKYDIVPESTHIHIEFDPKIRKVPIREPHKLPLTIDNYELTEVAIPEIQMKMPLYIRVISSPNLNTGIRIGKTLINIGSRYYAGITIFQPKPISFCERLCSSFVRVIQSIKKK